MGGGIVRKGVRKVYVCRDYVGKKTRLFNLGTWQRHTELIQGHRIPIETHSGSTRGGYAWFNWRRLWHSFI